MGSGCCTKIFSHVKCVPQVYRIAQYEIGPRRFWWWWCGGLKVYDATAVALWFALNILCVQQRVCLELPGLQGMYHRQKSIMWAALPCSLMR